MGAANLARELQLGHDLVWMSSPVVETVVAAAMTVVAAVEE